ncbi:MAG: hypothetical protein U0Q11_16145 [Vicinamibacterales bacterium]
MSVTVSEQLEVRCCASVAVHVTVVAPIENTDLLSGLQVVVMGEAPPLTVGTPYSTEIGEACADVSEIDAGQVMLGGATGGGVGVVGVVGDLVQLPVSISTPSRPSAYERAPWLCWRVRRGFANDINLTSVLLAVQHEPRAARAAMAKCCRF